MLWWHWLLASVAASVTTYVVLYRRPLISGLVELPDNVKNLSTKPLGRLASQRLQIWYYFVRGVLPTIAIIVLLGVFAGLSVAAWKVAEIGSLHIGLRVAIGLALWAPVLGIALRIFDFDDPDAALLSFIPAVFLGMGVAVWKLVESPLPVPAKAVIAVFGVGCPGLEIVASLYRDFLDDVDDQITRIATGFIPGVMVGLGVAIWKLVESPLPTALKVVIALFGVGSPGLGILALLISVALDGDYAGALPISLIPGALLGVGVGAWKPVESSLSIGAKVGIGVSRHRPSAALLSHLRIPSVAVKMVMMRVMYKVISSAECLSLYLTKTGEYLTLANGNANSCLEGIPVYYWHNGG